METGRNGVAHVLAAVALSLAAAVGAAGVRADPLVIEGRAEVIDATTLEIWGQRIRLADVDAPDPYSQAGRAGKQFLQDLLADIRVRCTVGDPSFAPGMAGRCFAASVDIGERLIQMGYARRTAAGSICNRVESPDCR